MTTLVVPLTLSGTTAKSVRPVPTYSAGSFARAVPVRAVAPVAHSATDLESEFAAWADESLEWSRATFSAQAETWPEY